MRNPYTYQLAAASLAQPSYEGFRTHAYWDVNHYRVGYGSDTWTDPTTGEVHEVTKGTVITRAEADADLSRRLPEFEDRAIKAVGQEAWDALPPQAQAQLISVTYNYGHLPTSVAIAVQTGDLATIADAVGNLAANPERRAQEASQIYSPVEVSALQTSLANAGYDPGPIDGKMGPQTRQAIEAFQTANGLTANGMVTADTATALSNALGGGTNSFSLAGPVPNEMYSPTGAPISEASQPVNLAPVGIGPGTAVPGSLAPNVAPGSAPDVNALAGATGTVVPGSLAPTPSASASAPVKILDQPRTEMPAVTAAASVNPTANASAAPGALVPSLDMSALGYSAAPAPSSGQPQATAPKPQVNQPPEEPTSIISSGLTANAGAPSQSPVTKGMTDQFFNDFIDKALAANSAGVPHDQIVNSVFSNPEDQARANQLMGSIGEDTMTKLAANSMGGLAGMFAGDKTVTPWGVVSGLAPDQQQLAADLYDSQYSLPVPDEYKQAAPAGGTLPLAPEYAGVFGEPYAGLTDAPMVSAPKPPAPAAPTSPVPAPTPAAPAAPAASTAPRAEDRTAEQWGDAYAALAASSAAADALPNRPPTQAPVQDATLNSVPGALAPTTSSSVPVVPVTPIQDPTSISAPSMGTLSAAPAAPMGLAPAAAAAAAPQTQAAKVQAAHKAATAVTNATRAVQSGGSGAGSAGYGSLTGGANYLGNGVYQNTTTGKITDMGSISSAKDLAYADRDAVSEAGARAQAGSGLY